MNNSRKPKISVIMSEYNTDEKQLKRSINSILKQSFQDFELIIVDDCGNNNVAKIVEQYKDNRIVLLKNKKNMGLALSLNKAIKKSKANYIARMDTDDISKPNRLELQYNYIKTHKDIDILGGNIEYFDEKGVWGTSRLYGPVTKEQIIKSCPLMHPTIFAKKKSLLKTGGYPNFNRCEDYALWIKMYSEGYSLFNMKDIVLKYHLSRNDYSKRSFKNSAGIRKMLRTHYRKYLKINRTTFYKYYLKNIIVSLIPQGIMRIRDKRRRNHTK